jgi:tetratricopeptide (TPR) repeat protein
MTLTNITHGQQSLPPKELSLFKKCVKLYEQKQHKNSLRCIKQILQNPSLTEHGETLAMKALILDVTGHHDEAVELSRVAVKNDVKSHVCWHIFGMVMRSDRKFGEAVKALKMALHLSPDNPQILRDLALVQAHIRDFKGFQLTRYTLLRLKPNNRQAWMGFIVSAYLAKDYDLALKGIQEYRKPLLQNAVANSPELFEVLQIEIRIYEESNRPETALDLALNPVTRFLDQTIYHETRGRLFMKLGRMEEASKEYQALIKRNPEKVEYFMYYEKCKELDKSGKEEERLELYDSITKRVKKTLYPKLAPLFFTSGKEFYRRLIIVIIDGLRIGLPSLFQTLRPLYNDKGKVQFIHSLLSVFIENIEKNGEDNVHLDGSSLPENPTTVMWTYYFIAHHFDVLKDYKKATIFVQKAINHTPTVVELYSCFARIEKHAGDMNAAMENAKRAHELDTADRYVNCKLVKYLMRCGKYEEALDYAGKFTKETIDALTSLVDMQSLWIEVELAHSLYQRDQLGPALKVCHTIEEQFTSFFDDQYDFHSYCMRKATICGYSDLIRMSDNIRNHRAFIKAANLATKIYLELDNRKNNPNSMNDGEKEDNEKKHESAEERKQRRKENKAKATQKANEAKKDEAKDALKYKIDGNAGEEFLKAKDFIENAQTFVEKLIELDIKNLEYYQRAFEVFRRKNKVLIMTKLIAKAFARYSLSRDFYKLFQDYIAYLDKNPVEGVTKQVTDAVIKKITGDRNYSTYKTELDKMFAQ